MTEDKQELRRKTLIDIISATLTGVIAGFVGGITDNVLFGVLTGLFLGVLLGWVTSHAAYRGRRHNNDD